MSIKLMAWVWENGPPTAADRFALLAIADHCNDEGKCWPSMAKLARKLCMTDRGAQKAIERLAETGWLHVEVGGGRGRTNVYTLMNPELSSPLAERVNWEAEKGELGDAKPRTPVHPNLKNLKEPYARGRARGFKSIGRKEGVNPFPPDFPYDHRLTFAENRKALDAWKAAQEQPA